MLYNISVNKKGGLPYDQYDNPARSENGTPIQPDNRRPRDIITHFFTVGDFRTRSEAVKLLERIRHDFPSAFVVKENISFPVVDKENAYVVDTVKVLRPVAVSL